MCPWVGPHVSFFGRQLWGAAQPCGVSLTIRGIAPVSLQYDRLTPVACVAWLATSSLTVYRLACHRLLPWLRVTFAMVPDAAWPGSDQQPWGTAPAAGPVGRQGRPSVSDPWGVVCCYLSLGCPWCACVCGVHGPLALVHRCTCPVLCVRGVSCMRCPWLLGDCSPVHVPCVLCMWCLWLR